MMGDPFCIGLCVVILLVAAAQGAAQAADSLRMADGTDEQPPPFLKTKPLDRKVMSGKKYKIGEHSYLLDEGSHGERQRAGPVNGHMREREEWRGEATHEGPRHLLKEAVGSLEEKQTSGASGDEWTGSIRMNSPGEEDKPPLVYGDESAGWSREADLWKYQEGQWKEVRLPDPTYSSLPTPDPPAAALVVNTIDKVEVERRLEGLKNVTIHCRFYLSHRNYPDILPELEVFFVTNGSRQKLWVDTTTEVWQEKTIHVPEADNSSVIVEGWLKAKGNIIALSNLYTEGVTPSRDEALDVDSGQMTLTYTTTENIVSPFATEEFWEGTADQDNTTRSSTIDETQIKTSPSPAKGNTEEGTETAMPTDEYGLEPSTDIPEIAVQTTEQIYGITDVATLNATLNSSMSGKDSMTSNGDASDDFNATVTTTNTENNETDGGENSLTASVTAGQLASSENDTEDAFETSGKADNSTTLSIPGLTTDSLQTITSVTLDHSNASATDGPFIPETSVNSESPSSIPTDTRFTDGQNLSTSVFKTTLGSSDAVFGTPYYNTTSEYATGGKEFPGGVIKVPTPPPAVNTTEAVVAVPVSSTSWQVFQIFLVLCVMGLLALGFLYWKRKRRQDDEIPVFTRHTDYPNPTFTMEDAANFMSRVGRNTYKSID